MIASWGVEARYALYEFDVCPVISTKLFGAKDDTFSLPKWGEVTTDTRHGMTGLTAGLLSLLDSHKLDF